MFRQPVKSGLARRPRSAAPARATSPHGAAPGTGGQGGMAGVTAPRHQVPSGLSPEGVGTRGPWDGARPGLPLLFCPILPLEAERIFGMLFYFSVHFVFDKTHPAFRLFPSASPVLPFSFHILPFPFSFFSLFYFLTALSPLPSGVPRAGPAPRPLPRTLPPAPGSSPRASPRLSPASGLLFLIPAAPIQPHPAAAWI